MSSGYGGISHTSTKKLPPFYTVFTVIESSVQLLGERHNEIKSNSTGFCLLQYPPTRKDGPTESIGDGCFEVTAFQFYLRFHPTE